MSENEENELFCGYKKLEIPVSGKRTFKITLSLY